ncbi:MAG: hypothetical protein IJC54_03690 [Clostridia bacterium]|nr:hypothetical protein [Clostridia bacterium]
MLNGVLIVVLTFLFSWQSFFARKYTENYAGANEADASNIYNIVYGTAIAVLTFALAGFRFRPSLPTVLLGLVNAAMLTTYNKSLVKASVLGPYSFQMLCLLSGGILVPMLYNMLFMGERLTGVQLLGIAVLIAAIAIMNLQGLSFKGKKPSRAYFICCIVLFIVNGFYGQLMNIQQSVMAGAEREEMIMMTYGVTALGVLAAMLRRPADLKAGFRMGKKSALFAAGACLVATTAANLLVYLISVMESVTVLFAIDNGGVMLLSALYSIFLFKEKATPSQLIGMGLSILSIVLLSI